MKHSIFLLLLMISLPVCAQNITGLWSWNSEDGQANFILELKEENRAVTGTHCAVFQSGNRIDCTEDSEDEVSVKLVLISENIYEGSIKSGYSLTTGKIKLEYKPKTKA